MQDGTAGPNSRDQTLSVNGDRYISIFVLYPIKNRFDKNEHARVDVQSAESEDPPHKHTLQVRSNRDTNQRHYVCSSFA